MKKRTKIIIGIVVAILVIGVIGGIAGGSDESSQPVASSQESSAAESSSASVEAETPASDLTKLEYGELLDETTNYGVTVIKAKISPSATNNMTIDQNYYNVEDYIKTHDMNGITELQYWAVADMNSGNESKVVSFTVPEELIAKIQAGDVPANQLGDYVTDLWVHQSLKD